MSKAGRAGAVTSATFVLAAAAACGDLLGINDRSLDTQGDGGVVGADSSVGVDSSVAEGGPAEGGASAAAADAPSESSTTGDSGVVDAALCPTPCPVVTGLDLPLDVTSDSNNVYWTEFGDTFGAVNGSVKSCPLSGCSGAPKVYATGQPNPGQLASDGANLYWSADAPGTGGGGIYYCPVTGCLAGPKLLVGAELPWGIALDATYVYFVSQNDMSLHRVPKAGGADDTLWDGGDSGIYYPVSCAADDASVYVLDQNSSLFRVPLGGGDGVTLYDNGAYSGVSDQGHLLLDPKRAIFGDGYLGVLVAASKTTADASVALVPALQNPVGVAQDPATSDIYWTDLGSGLAHDGSIGRARSDGTNTTIVANGLVDPTALTVGGGYVYWVEPGPTGDAGLYETNAGTLYRAPK